MPQVIQRHFKCSVVQYEVLQVSCEKKNSFKLAVNQFSQLSYIVGREMTKLFQQNILFYDTIWVCVERAG